MCGGKLPAPRRKPLPTKVAVAEADGQRSCPHCGASVARTAKVCAVCEQPLRASRAGRDDPAENWTPLSVLGAQFMPKVDRRRKQQSCPACGARIDEQADVCPMCHTDLHLAAVTEAVSGGVHLESEDGSEAPQTDASGPLVLETRRLRRALPRAWVWALAAVLLVVAALTVSKIYRATRNPSEASGLVAEQEFTPTAQTTPTRVARAPTYTFTPTSTVTRTRRPTSTPVPTGTPTPTPTSTLTPTPRPTPTPVVHVVQSGETLYSIARTYDIDVAELSQANGLTLTSFLHPDDQLVIPIPVEDGTPTVEASPIETLHTVQEGERLSDIAQRYGISVLLLRRLNDLEDSAVPSPGDQLIVPLINGTAPTATVAPTARPTPGLPYPAPKLLYPLQNAEFEGPGETVMLEWTSVGILSDGDWYALSLRYLGSRAEGQPSEITLYTRVTSWRVPDEWYPGLDMLEHRFEWTVQVVRRQDLSAPPEAISPSADLRRFTWS
jgi:LysM repeat protein